jgi:hypothetical protein
MLSEKNTKQNVKQVPLELVSFFDLLAKFDFEDKKREKSVFEIGLLASAPRGSISNSDNKKIYGADNKVTNK